MINCKIARTDVQAIAAWAKDNPKEVKGLSDDQKKLLEEIFRQAWNYSQEPDVKIQTDKAGLQAFSGIADAATQELPKTRTTAYQSSLLNRMVKGIKNRVFDRVTTANVLHVARMLVIRTPDISPVKQLTLTPQGYDHSGSEEMIYDITRSFINNKPEKTRALLKEVAAAGDMRVLTRLSTRHGIDYVRIMTEAGDHEALSDPELLAKIPKHHMFLSEGELVTPLAYAKSKGMTKVVSALVAAGAQAKEPLFVYGTSWALTPDVFAKFKAGDQPCIIKYRDQHDGTLQYIPSIKKEDGTYYNDVKGDFKIGGDDTKCALPSYEDCQELTGAALVLVLPAIEEDPFIEFYSTIMPSPDECISLLEQAQRDLGPEDRADRWLITEYFSKNGKDAVDADGVEQGPERVIKMGEEPSNRDAQGPDIEAVSAQPAAVQNPSLAYGRELKALADKVCQELGFKKNAAGRAPYPKESAFEPTTPGRALALKSQLNAWIDAQRTAENSDRVAVFKQNIDDIKLG